LFALLTGVEIQARGSNLSYFPEDEQVNPDNLAASFGPGVALRGATIAITNDPVTSGIEEKLGWLRSLNGGYLTSKHASSSGLAGMLHAGKFERNL
jgi:hypothetical protein